jgi:recombination protein RecT
MENLPIDFNLIQTNLQELLISKSEALPKGFNQTRFLQNCMSVLRDIRDIEKITTESIRATILKGAFLGLDFFNKECYAIVYNRNTGTKDKPVWIKDLQFQTDYKGEIKLAKKYSLKPIHDIYAKVVREGDAFEEFIADGKPSINFKPTPFNNNPIVGVFAVCLYDDSTMIYDTMSKDEIELIRKTYSKTPDGKIWKESWGEMAKKTVIRRLCKLIEWEFDNIEQTEAYRDSSEMVFDDMEVKPPIKMPEPLPANPDDLRTVVQPGLGKMNEKEKAEFLTKVEKMKKNCPPDDWERLITDFKMPDTIDTVEDSVMFLKILSEYVNKWLAKQNDGLPF